MRYIIMLITGVIFYSCAPKFQQGPVLHEDSLKMSGEFTLVSAGKKEQGTMYAEIDDKKKVLHFYSNFGTRYLSVSTQQDSVVFDPRGHSPRSNEKSTRVVFSPFFTQSPPVTYGELLEILLGYFPSSLAQNDSAYDEERVRITSETRPFGAGIASYHITCDSASVVLDNADDHHFRTVSITLDSSNYIDLKYY
ncbi:MAG: hypothetical protein ACQEQ4_04385 [Fibrobacterota bacterium]